MLTFPLWKRILIAVICTLGVLYAMPNFLPTGVMRDMPEWAPGKRVSLGLDLQGGAHLLMQVEVDAYVRELLDRSYREDVRTAMRQADVSPNAVLSDGRIEFQIRDAEKREPVLALIRRNSPDLQVQHVGDGRYQATLREDAMVQRVNTVVDQSIEVIRRRIDEMGTREPVIQRQGADRILIQVPGLEDTERLKALIGQTARMTFHLVDMQCDPSGTIPPGSELVPSAELGPDGQPFQYCLQRRVRLTGESLVDAQPTFQDNRPVVSFRFDARGARVFGQITTENVGRLFAIVLDGEVITAPRIEEPIRGGSGIIRGNFTVAETRDLSILLRAGALPASLTYLEERSVGPGLGQDSIEAGRIASIIAMVLVLIFMVVVYGLFGIFANVALLFNITLILAILTVLQATLTLPGIAGIVLTMGMAVDANVLIYERIREEVRAGRSPLNAIDAGFRRSLTTILDSNLTTLIAAIILFMLGSGPIRGFAVTLSIGIITSLFTAMMVTRFLVVMWLRKTRPAALPV